jgi:hypothetical protein
MMNTIARCKQHFMLVLFSMIISIATIAQETKKVDVDVSTKTDGGAGFFASPWVWVVGVAVFILLLVALLGRRRDA